MKFLPNLILRAAFLFLAVQFVPQYGEVVSGLFDQVSNGLTVDQARI